MNQSQSSTPTIKPLFSKEFKIFLWCISLLLIVGVVYGELRIYQEVGLVKREHVSLQNRIETVTELVRVINERQMENKVIEVEKNQQPIEDDKVDISDWQIYQNENYGYDVKYPANWSYADLYPQVNAYNPQQTIGFSDQEIIFEENKPILNKNLIEISVGENPRLLRGKDWIDYVSGGYFSEVRYEVISHDPLLEVVKAEFHGAGDLTETYFLSSDKVFIIRLSATSNSQQTEKIYNQMIKNFRLLQ